MYARRRPGPVRGRSDFRRTAAFVGNADSRGWLAAMDKMLLLNPAPVVVIPGHGAASRDPARDLSLTRDYLVYLRSSMGRAVRELRPSTKPAPRPTGAASNRCRHSMPPTVSTPTGPTC